MAHRRVIFRNKGAAPTAAPVASVSVRMPRAPVLFIVKAIAPALGDCAGGCACGGTGRARRLQLRPPHNRAHVRSGLKALHTGEITVSDAARANDAYLAGRPLPHGLIKTVLARSRE